MENYSWEVTFNLPNNEKEVVKTFVEDTNTKSDLSDIKPYISRSYRRM